MSSSSCTATITPQVAAQLGVSNDSYAPGAYGSLIYGASIPNSYFKYICKPGEVISSYSGRHNVQVDRLEFTASNGEVFVIGGTINTGRPFGPYYPLSISPYSTTDASVARADALRQGYANGLQPGFSALSVFVGAGYTIPPTIVEGEFDGIGPRADSIGRVDSPQFKVQCLLGFYIVGVYGYHSNGKVSMLGFYVGQSKYAPCPIQVGRMSAPLLTLDSSTQRNLTTSASVSFPTGVRLLDSMQVLSQVSFDNAAHVVVRGMFLDRHIDQYNDIASNTIKAPSSLTYTAADNVVLVKKNAALLLADIYVKHRNVFDTLIAPVLIELMIRDNGNVVPHYTANNATAYITEGMRLASLAPTNRFAIGLTQSMLDRLMLGNVEGFDTNYNQLNGRLVVASLTIHALGMLNVFSRTVAGQEKWTAQMHDFMPRSIILPLIKRMLPRVLNRAGLTFRMSDIGRSVNVSANVTDGANYDLILEEMQSEFRAQHLGDVSRIMGLIDGGIQTPTVAGQTQILQSGGSMSASPGILFVLAFAEILGAERRLIGNFDAKIMADSAATFAAEGFSGYNIKPDGVTELDSPAYGKVPATGMPVYVTVPDVFFTSLFPLLPVNIFDMNIYRYLHIYKYTMARVTASGYQIRYNPKMDRYLTAATADDSNEDEDVLIVGKFMMVVRMAILIYTGMIVKNSGTRNYVESRVLSGMFSDNSLVKLRTLVYTSAPSVQKQEALNLIMAFNNEIEAIRQRKLVVCARASGGAASKRAAVDTGRLYGIIKNEMMDTLLSNDKRVHNAMFMAEMEAISPLLFRLSLGPTDPIPSGLLEVMSNVIDQAGAFQTQQPMPSGGSSGSAGYINGGGSSSGDESASANMNNTVPVNTQGTAPPVPFVVSTEPVTVTIPVPEIPSSPSTTATTTNTTTTNTSSSNTGNASTTTTTTGTTTGVQIPVAEPPFIPATTTTGAATTSGATTTTTGGGAQSTSFGDLGAVANGSQSAIVRKEPTAAEIEAAKKKNLDIGASDNSDGTGWSNAAIAGMVVGGACAVGIAYYGYSSLKRKRGE